jgi:arylformamidase
MSDVACGPMSWRSLDLAALEREYSPSSCIGGNYQPFIAAYAERSRAARARACLQGRGQLNLRYGARDSQCLDLFMPDLAPGASAAPLLVFIHGGYWQELSKDESAFAAGDCVDQGFACAALDYTLAPHATVAEIVAECRQAVAWLHGNAASLGFDPGRIVVAGSSAGAHLAAMTALPGTVGGRAQHIVKGAVLVSGVYELEPLIGTPVNAALSLTVDTARAVSPALFDLQGFPPSIVCWGNIETMEFKRQSRDFAALLARAGRACRQFEVPQRNHFDVILDLADPGTELGRAVADMLRS